MMTISQFSDRTGLSPSALRYYESQGLIVPELRQPNGYRLYGELQIPEAKLINSLRQAGVGMGEIVRFLQGSNDEKDMILTQWRHEVEARLLSIQSAKHYLLGLNAHSPPLHLLRWNKPLPMIWLRQKIGLKREETLPKLLTANQQLLADHALRVKRGAYVCFLNTTPEGFDVEVGYALERPRRRALPQSLSCARYELMAPTLFATVECTEDDSLACFPMIQTLHRYGFESIGPRLERHVLGVSTYEVMIPVVQEKVGD